MLISIVTVVYNSLNNLEITLDSIRKIKNNSIEYIVIDGNSNDGTLELLKKNNDIIDILISENDKGIYDAMNKGIENSNGKYISFLNAGDSYFDDFIESTSILLNSDIDVLSFGIDMIRKNKSPLHISPTKIILSKFDPQHMYLPHPGLLVRNELFKKVGKFNLNLKSAADLEWVNRLILNYNYKIVIIDKALVKFLSGGISFSINSFREARNISIFYNKSVFQSNYIYYKQILYYALYWVKTKINV
jgi:glycosyltransferase involved in cell wall biosynthesis